MLRPWDEDTSHRMEAKEAYLPFVGSFSHENIISVWDHLLNKTYDAEHKIILEDHSTM